MPGQDVQTLCWDSHANTTNRGPFTGRCDTYSERRRYLCRLTVASALIVDISARKIFNKPQSLFVKQVIHGKIIYWTDALSLVKSTGHRECAHSHQDMLQINVILKLPFHTTSQMPDVRGNNEFWIIYNSYYTINACGSSIELRFFLRKKRK